MATRHRNSGAAFVGLGIAFLALGLGRHPAFLALGITFLVIGASHMRRSQRRD